MKIVEDSCFDRLREYAKVVSHEFIVNNLHYGGTLQFIATSLEDRPEYSVDSVQSWLKDMRPFLKEQKISMLLPGDTVILPNGAIAQASALGLSYDKEKSAEAHVSVRLEGENQNEKFLYHFVPVKNQGQTVAMIFWNYSLGLIHQYLRADKDYDRVLNTVDYAIQSEDETTREDGYHMKTTSLLHKGDTVQWLSTLKEAMENTTNVNYPQIILKYYYDQHNCNDSDMLFHCCLLVFHFTFVDPTFHPI